MFRVLGLRNSELNSSHPIHKESQSKRPHRCRENKRPNCLPSRWLGGWTAILTVQHDVEKHRREDTIRVIECSDWHIVSGSINGRCYCGLNPVHFDAWLPNWEAHLICPLAMNKSIKDSQKKKNRIISLRVHLCLKREQCIMWLEAPFWLPLLCNHGVIKWPKKFFRLQIVSPMLSTS